MSLIVVVPPTETVLALADAKAHLRVESDFVDDDALITAYISVAISYCENKVQRKFQVQQLDWIAPNLDNGMRVPLAPVVSVDSIKYLTYPYGPEVTLDPSQYIVAPQAQGVAIVRPYYLRWPWVGQGPKPVTVRFTVGGAALISPGALHAIKMVLAHLYEFRSPTIVTRGQASQFQISAALESVVDDLLFADRWE